MRYTVLSVLATFTLQIAASPVSSLASHVQFRGPLEVTPDSIHNIHIDYLTDEFQGDLHMVYGSCDLEGIHQRDHQVGITHVEHTVRPTRFVWVVPKEMISLGCLSAFSNGQLIGRSTPIPVGRTLKSRELISDVADWSGPWFDGVAYMKSKNNTDTFVAAAKSKKIAIVGGGMSGLLTSHILQSVGIEDWQIMESSQRVGGRIRTKYLNGTTPDQYQYQEMGPMRFPVSVTYADTNETLEIKDHHMVFQLGDTMNKLNNYNESLAVNFIPWIQSSPNLPASSNGYRLPNGRIPSAAQIAANATLGGVAQTSSNATEEAVAEAEYDAFIGLTRDELRLLASNVFEAHRKAIEDGEFDWSEANFLRYKMGISLNVTDFIAGAGGSALWGSMYDVPYFAATTWKTIDKGLESLPKAFMPHVENRTIFGRFVSGLSHNESTDKISVHWRTDSTKYGLATENEEFDYAVVAVPFSKVRMWELPAYSSLLSRSISTLNYEQSCKVALHYKTRFWEHMDAPIFGGCGSVDIPGVSSVCYPSYKINSTGPGVILASYVSGTLARSAASLSESDHVALIQRAMIQVHGDIATEQWTGNYDRQCWEVDEHQAGAWASPLVGQQELYLPAYYRTEFKTIFIGEHTSYTHAWIFSALDSAVRGSAQLLLDMGLVDEAKSITKEWMGRWMTV